MRRQPRRRRRRHLRRRRRARPRGAVRRPGARRLGEIARLAGQLGVPQRTLTAPDQVSTRYTDPETLEVVVLALAGAVKPKIVAELSRLGVPAVGLTGLDGGMLRARRKSAVGPSSTAGPRWSGTTSAGGSPRSAPTCR